MTLLLLLVACDQRGPEARLGAREGVPSSAVPTATGVSSIEARPKTGSTPSASSGSAMALSDGLTRWLRESSVTEERFARRTLYSWTTAATETRLRRTRTLFDDNQLPEGKTAYVRWLEHVASRRDASGRLARVLLGHPDLRQRRYAWARPWATRRGLAERDYGDRLVRVVLKPHALVGRFDPSAPRVWRFVDMDQRPVPLARALAQPGRIGAIYHLRRPASKGLHYREYVLCNESMVETWSLATEPVQAALAQDSQQLRQWAAAAPAELAAVAEHWRAAAEGDRHALMASTLAFDVPHYQPSRANLLAIADLLDASPPAQHPLIVRPSRRFRDNAAPKLITVRQLPPRVMVEA